MTKLTHASGACVHVDDSLTRTALQGLNEALVDPQSTVGEPVGLLRRTDRMNSNLFQLFPGRVPIEAKPVGEFLAGHELRAKIAYMRLGHIVLRLCGHRVRGEVCLHHAISDHRAHLNLGYVRPGAPPPAPR